MLRTPSIWFAWILMLGGLFVWSGAQTPAPAAPAGRGIVKVARVVGEVYVTDTATSLKTRLAGNSLVTDGQVVETGPKASVVLVFSNGAVVSLRADSRLEVAEFRQNPFTAPLSVGQATHEPSTSSTKLFLRKGEIISQVKKLNRDAGSSFTVETPVGAAGIRGTAFELVYNRSGDLARFALTMAEGLIRFTPVRGRSVEVGAGKALSFDAQVDATTGRVLSVPEAPAPTDVAPADAARLQSALAEAVGAAASIQFTPATGTNGGFTVGATSSSSTDASSAPATDTAVPSTGADATSSAVGSPPASPDQPRLSAGDGM